MVQGFVWRGKIIVVYKKVFKIFIITAVVLGIFALFRGAAKLYYFAAYHIIGEIALTVNGNEVSCDGCEIGIEDNMGNKLVETCKIQRNQFCFRREQYGNVCMRLTIPAEYLEDCYEDIDVEINFYNNVTAVTKFHDIRIEITNIDDKTCHVYFADKWKPAYDFCGIVSNELVGDRSVTGDKKVTGKNIKEA